MEASRLGGDPSLDEDEWDPDWDPLQEVVEIYGEDWMEKHGIVISSETCFPGLEAGWFVCTLCHKQLAGMYGMYGHLKSRGHREWVTLKNIELGPQAAAIAATPSSRKSSGAKKGGAPETSAYQAPPLLGGWQAPPLPESQVTRPPPLAPPSAAAPRSPKANKMPSPVATPSASATSAPAIESESSDDEEAVVQEKVGPISWESHPIGAPPPLPSWPMKNQSMGSQTPPPPSAPPPPATSLPPCPPPDLLAKHEEEQTSATSPTSIGSVKKMVEDYEHSLRPQAREAAETPRARRPSSKSSEDAIEPETDKSECRRISIDDRQVDATQNEQRSSDTVAMCCVTRSYTGEEISEIGESEAGYLPVEIGDIIERLCSPVEGHSRNQEKEYVFGRRYVDGVAEQQGWLPAAVLQASSENQDVVVTSRMVADEEKRVDREGAPISPPPAFLGA